jgi:hypothetical protein
VTIIEGSGLPPFLVGIASAQECLAMTGRVKILNTKSEILNNIKYQNPNDQNGFEL